MKRKIDKSYIPRENTLLLPLEILEHVANQFYAHTIKDIFSFLLLCKTAEIYLPLVLKGWASRILSKSIGELNRSLFYFIENKGLVFDFIVDLYEKGVDDVFLRGLFDLQKHLLLGRYWIVKGNVSKYAIYGQRLTKIMDLFYYDKSNNTVIPLSKIPGIKAFHAPGIRKRLGKMIDESTDNSFVVELAHRGLKRISYYGKYDIYYRMCKSKGIEMTMVEHDINDSNIGCVVIEDYHIYSQEGENIYNNLYTSDYKKPVESKDHPYQCKEYAILQYITEDDRFAEILKRMGVTYYKKGEHVYNSDGDE